MTLTLTNEASAHTGQDKITRYKWEVEDSPGTLKSIPKNQLIVNDEYQRNANASKVLDLARNWSWMACGAICVARRKGTYWVVDGQHRVLAAKKRSDIDQLPCIVFATTDIAEEAQGFLNANTNRKPVSAVAKHHAAVVAGDAIAIKMQSVFDALGITVSEKTSGDPSHIRCVASARQKAQDDFEGFREVLRVGIELARSGGVQMHERLFDGLWYLSRHVEGGFDQPRFQKRLREVGAEKLVDGASRAAAFFARGGRKVFATGMLEVLNKGLHKRFTLKNADDE